jgi:hypothetical protein
MASDKKKNKVECEEMPTCSQKGSCVLRCQRERSQEAVWSMSPKSRTPGEAVGGAGMGLESSCFSTQPAVVASTET